MTRNFYTELLKYNSFIINTFREDGFVMVRFANNGHIFNEEFSLLLRPSADTNDEKYKSFKDKVAKEFPNKYFLNTNDITTTNLFEIIGNNSADDNK